MITGNVLPPPENKGLSKEAELELKLEGEAFVLTEEGGSWVEKLLSRFSQLRKAVRMVAWLLQWNRKEKRGEPLTKHES